jgi:hypothetical protein
LATCIADDQYFFPRRKTCYRWLHCQHSLGQPQ